LPRDALYEAWRRLSWPPVERAVAGADVVHSTTVIVPPRWRAPLVVTVHDLAFLHDPSHFSSHGRRAMTAGFHRVRAKADLVLCSSRATLDDCAAAGIGHDRLRHVPLGIAPVERPDVVTVEAVRRRLGLERPYLLFVGTLEPRKNLPRLIEAVDHLSTCHDLAVVGPEGWGEQASWSKRVRALGFVDEGTKAALYAGADAVCYPSLREGFGLPVLEAMAYGTPVVTSRGTAAAEVGGDAAVLVDPLDVGDIARGIDEAISQRSERAAAGLAQATSFTWRATADLVVAAYREVAA
jgi:glycosyltransferase involved in cell wall biosynthesis